MKSGKPIGFMAAVAAALRPVTLSKPPKVYIGPPSRQIIMMPYWCKRQPGWRAERSRARHHEIARRRRRNSGRNK